jgi:hypothetical protein
MSEPLPTEVVDQTPTIHRVLIPSDSFFVYGFLAQSTVLPGQPMMWLGRELTVILPINCVVERWTRGEAFHEDWTIMYSPPGRISTEWLANHPDWETAPVRFPPPDAA